MELKPLIKAALPLFISSWIFGVGIFQCPLGTPRPTFSLIYSSTLIIIYCLFASIAYPKFVELATLFGTVVPMKIYFYTNILLTFSMITMGWFRSEAFDQCLLKAAQADNLMQRIGIAKNYKKMLQNQVWKVIIGLIFVLSIMTMNAVIIFTQNFMLSERILLTCVSCYPIMIMFISDSIFTGSVRCACYRFQKLNQQLNIMISRDNSFQHVEIADLINSSARSSSNVITIVRTKNSTSVIRLAKQIHLQLINMCQEATNAYGLQILLSVGTAFAIITAHAYISYETLIDKHLPKDLMYKLLTTSNVWIVYYALKIANFSWVCSACVESATQTGDVINKLYDKPFICDETKHEIRDFNIQLIQKPLEFTACGFITLDCSLLRKIVASIVTYMMILIELKRR